MVDRASPTVHGIYYASSFDFQTWYKLVRILSDHNTLNP
jgi:hypothetical protein